MGSRAHWEREIASFSPLLGGIEWWCILPGMINQFIPTHATFSRAQREIETVSVAAKLSKA